MSITHVDGVRGGDGGGCGWEGEQGGKVDVKVDEMLLEVVVWKSDV